MGELNNRKCCVEIDLSLAGMKATPQRRADSLRITVYWPMIEEATACSYDYTLLWQYAIKSSDYSVELKCDGKSGSGSSPLTDTSHLKGATKIHQDVPPYVQKHHFCSIPQLDNEFAGRQSAVDILLLEKFIMMFPFAINNQESPVRNSPVAMNLRCATKIFQCVLLSLRTKV